MIPRIRRFFDDCISILEERSEEYGNFGLNLNDISEETGAILMKGIVYPSDIALILASLKWTRIKSNKDGLDSYIDMCNYLAAAVVCRGIDNRDDEAESV